MSHPSLPAGEGTTDPSHPARRGFLAAIAAVAAAGLAFLAPVWSGIRVALDPLGRAGEDPDLVRVASLAALPADGVPRKFRILADKIDAWNTHVNFPVGTVYLRRTGDSVEALDVEIRDGDQIWVRFRNFLPGRAEKLPVA